MPSLPRLGAGRGGSINACRRYRDICSPLGVSWQFDKFLDAASSAVDGCSCRHCCVGWSAASIVSKQQLLVPVAWLVRLRRLGQEAHDPYPSLVGVAEGHAWRWQSPVAWERDLGGGVGVDDNVNTRYTYLAVRDLKATRWRRRGGKEDFGEFSLGNERAVTAKGQARSGAYRGPLRTRLLASHAHHRLE